jgi:hypothetical protein
MAKSLLIAIFTPPRGLQDWQESGFVQGFLGRAAYDDLTLAGHGLARGSFRPIEERRNSRDNGRECAAGCD